MRKFIRRLLMLHPGYRKAHFVELEVQELRRELVGLLEGNEARVKAAIAAARPADRTDEVLQAIAAAKPADRTDELLAAIAAVRSELTATSDNLTKQIKDSCETLFRNDIRCRWQVVDALDGLLFPPSTPVKCLVCGHEALKSTYETRISECIFGGGRLERFVCPECGCVFGPLKMMALAPNQLAAEYVQNYSVYRETDCTFLERPTFMALKPTKNGVYLNYGAGAWNHTTVELREAGYTVYDFEPYAPTGDRPWVIRSKDELGKMKFDGIFSNDLIEHFQYPVESLLEMKKLLKPGGVMAHTTGCYDYEYEYTRFHYAFFLGKSLSILSDRIGMVHQLQTARLDERFPLRLCLFTIK